MIERRTDVLPYVAVGRNVSIYLTNALLIFFYTLNWSQISDINNTYL